MNRWLLAVLFACALAHTAAAQVPGEKIGALLTFVTTKDQAQTSLGAPAFEGHSPDGRSSLVYSYPVPLTEKEHDGQECSGRFYFRRP